MTKTQYMPGERLRELRGSRTMCDVATAIGISQSALSMYETNQRTPSPSVMMDIADYYGVSVGWLFFDEHIT